ncbi:MAG TPA: nucleoside recognition domain-containing protein [Symbiobacteriaceae bacterium]|nr:nucleoside recognition domain-containing protein [Symbiobacteriaceae bacterium]
MMVLQWMWAGFVAGVMKIVDLWWLVLLFIAIQVLKDAGWLDRISRWMRPILAPLRLPGEAGLPVAAGLAVGLTYGSGVVLQAGEEGRLTRAELTVTCVFLGICHAVIEETILFSAAGTSGLLLVSVRAVAGLVFAFGASRILLKKA